MPGIFQEAAPAKINLALHVTGRRADGYHMLESLVAFADAGDTVTMSDATADGFSIGGPFASGLSATSDNLVTRARDALRARHPFPPVMLHLDKRLPVASGIGGGSADAAATLRLLQRRFGIAADVVSEVARGLGADVPMCLAGRPLVARGIGDTLAPLAAFPPLALLLANPGAAVSTPEVFAGLRNQDNPPLPALPESGADWAEWISRTRNDLQGPAIALCPAVADVLLALAATAPRLVRMSGSGATCFGIYDTAEAAAAAARAISAAQPGWWVMAVQTGGASNGD